MKIGILETGEVHPDLKARYGDYPAMFEALLRSADPGLDFAVVRVVARLEVGVDLAGLENSDLHAHVSPAVAPKVGGRGQGIKRGARRAPRPEPVSRRTGRRWR